MFRTPNVYGYFTATYTPIDPLSLALSGTYTGSMDVPHLQGYIEKYCCPIKVLIRHKLGLIPFSGISPLWLFSSYEKTKINHEQKYTF